VHQAGVGVWRMFGEAAGAAVGTLPRGRVGVWLVRRLAAVGRFSRSPVGGPAVWRTH